MFIINAIILLLRFLLRLIRDIDGLFTYLTTFFLKSRYTFTGQCKKRGVCCKNIAIYLSQGFWDSVLLTKLAIWWYTFVYSFELISTEPSHRILVFRCNYLKNNSCSIYRRRPFICRNYPMARYFSKPNILPGCGYNIILNKKKDYSNYT